MSNMSNNYKIVDNPITDIQKRDIKTIMDIYKLSEKELMKKALGRSNDDDIPSSIDGLNYQEAAVLFRYGEALRISRSRTPFKDAMKVLILIIFIMLIIIAIFSPKDQKTSITKHPDYVPFSEIEKRMKSPDCWKTQDDPIMAYIKMKKFVKNRLKAPSTAKFPGVFDNHVRYIGDQTYVIASFVDSQNSFGATLRIYFTGAIKQVSKDEWELLHLKFLE